MMMLTHIAEDPWADAEEIPCFTPPPFDFKSCHVPLTAERAVEVVKAHIQRTLTAQLEGQEHSNEAAESSATISAAPSVAAQSGPSTRASAHVAEPAIGTSVHVLGPATGASVRVSVHGSQLHDAAGGWAKGAANEQGGQEPLEGDGVGILSPPEARKLLDADLMDAWMRDAGKAAGEEGEGDSTQGGEDGHRGGSRTRHSSALAPLSRRLSCPEGLLNDTHANAGGAEQGHMQQDALEPLANHHEWMLRRTRWADADAEAPYGAGNALHPLHEGRRYLLSRGGGDGWQPRDAVSIFAAGSSAAQQYGRSRLSRLIAEGADEEAVRSLAAVIIQSYCRGWMVRRGFARLKSAQRVEESRKKERAAAAALAREQAAVRRQLRAAARDCLLAVHAQQDYERTRARLTAARGLGSGAVAAPPAETPTIPASLWERCKALGQDPIQVLLDGGLMSHQIEDIIAASQLASQLPRRAAAVAARFVVSGRRSAAGDRVSGGGRSSAGGGSADEKSASVSEDGGSGAVRRTTQEGMELASAAVAAPVIMPRLSLPGRAGPPTGRGSAKQLQGLQVVPEMNTAQLVAQMLAGQQAPGQQQQQQGVGTGPGPKRQSTGSGMTVPPLATAAGATWPAPGSQTGQPHGQIVHTASVRTFQLPPAHASHGSHGGFRGQVHHGPAGASRRRMSDFVGGSGGGSGGGGSFMPPVPHTTSSSSLNLSVMGNAAGALGQADTRGAPVRPRSMGVEPSNSSSAAAAGTAGVATAPPPQMSSTVRVTLPILLEQSEKAANRVSNSGVVPASMPELARYSSGNLALPHAFQPQPPPQAPMQLPQHLNPHFSSTTNSPVPRSSFGGGASDGAPALRRRHSYVGSMGVTGSNLLPAAPGSGNTSSAGAAPSSAGGLPAETAAGTGYPSASAAVAVLGRLASRGSHRSLNTMQLQAQGAGALPPLIPNTVAGRWSHPGGGAAASGASPGSASPSTPPLAVAPASGAATGALHGDGPHGRLRRGSNLAPLSGLAAGSSPVSHGPIMIRRLTASTSGNGTATGPGLGLSASPA